MIPFGVSLRKSTPMASKSPQLEQPERRDYSIPVALPPWITDRRQVTFPDVKIEDLGATMALNVCTVSPAQAVARGIMGHAIAPTARSV